MLLQTLAPRATAATDTLIPELVTETDLTAEQVTQMRDGSNVGIFRTGGVCASTLEQNELGAAGGSCGTHGILKFTEAGHSGGDNQGLAGGSSLFDQRQVIVLETGDLVGGCIEIFKKFNGCFVKRRAEADQIKLAGSIHDRSMPLPRGISLLIEIMKVLARPERIRVIDLKAATPHVQGHRVSGISL